jgi:hypothetical protein
LPLAQLKVIIFSLFFPYVARWVTSLLDSFITTIYSVGVYFGDGSPPRPDLIFELSEARYLFPITNNVIAALLSLFVVGFLSATAQPFSQNASESNNY